MKRFIIFLAVICILVLMIGIAVYFPISSLPTNSDFSAIYTTDLALVNGISIYDDVAMRQFVQSRSGIPDEQFILVQFLYPTWYSLSTFYLGFLSAPSAATLWFEMNLVMLFLSIWLLTDGWVGRIRLFTFPLGLSFLPVLGALIVGQYDFPVLLGISFLLYGLKKENIPAVVSGAVLVTFKPHIGALIFIFLLIWLFIQQNDFGKRSLKYILAVLCMLMFLSFIVDIHWVSGYLNMLLSNQKDGNVSACFSECISLPILISRWWFDGSLRTAVLIGGTILMLLMILYYFYHSYLLKSSTFFVTASILATLLASPYFFNYDFIFLLIPFAVLFENKTNKFTWIILTVCYLAPYIAIGIYGRDGNIALIVITIILSLLFSLKLQSIDDSVTNA